MNRRQNDLEGRCEESHTVALTRRLRREEIGLAVKIPSDGFLADGSSHDRLEPALECFVARSFQIGQRALTGLVAQLAEMDGGISAEVAQK